MFAAETAGIAIGLALALGIFSFKTAVGGYYLISLPGHRLGKGIILFILWIAYFALFQAAFFLMEHISLFRIAENSTGFLNAGIPVHLLLCAGMVIWGTKLLTAHEEPREKSVSRGWLLLAVPCPVCAFAIFLVCSFASMLFPESIRLMRWLVPAAFLISNLVFLLLLHTASKLFRIRPLPLTGGIMILIALYFFLILITAPGMDSAEKLYAAACSSSDLPDLSWKSISVYSILLAALLAGFILKYHQKHRSVK